MSGSVCRHCGVRIYFDGLLWVHVPTDLTGCQLRTSAEPLDAPGGYR